MSYLGPCGRREDHEPHTVTAAPEGGVGGHVCDGQGSPMSAMELEIAEFFSRDRGHPCEPPGGFGRDGALPSMPLLWQGDNS